MGYLKREYVVGSKLIHERIIRIFQFGKDRGIPYLAMEWFVGGTMKARLRQGLDMLLAVGPEDRDQATEAVALFNGQGWVHRDIKPDNFLVADDGDVKLIDFALAQRKRERVGPLVSAAQIQGAGNPQLHRPGANPRDAAGRPGRPVQPGVYAL